MNIFDMTGMFINCSSLKPFPDISEINTSHTIYMGKLFFGCSSLTSLPDYQNGTLVK